MIKSGATLLIALFSLNVWATSSQPLSDGCQPWFSNADIAVGKSPQMLEVLNLVRMVSKVPTTVLIQGETGTGKEVIARLIHHQGTRKSKPFIAVNCGALPENLVETEFFGHAKGAFTGALSSKVGLFDAANEGTLFLDEIGELPLALQSKLLRVLQEKEIRPVGATESHKIDVRIIAATNQNLVELVRQRKFREDLYYRLAVVPIKLVPLRERPEDIVTLANELLKKHAKELGLNVSGFTSGALAMFLQYDWPGNVRELENVIQRALVLKAGKLWIDAGDIVLPERISSLLPLPKPPVFQFPKAKRKELSRPKPISEIPQPESWAMELRGLIKNHPDFDSTEFEALEEALFRTDGGLLRLSLRRRGVSEGEVGAKSQGLVKKLRKYFHSRGLEVSSWREIQDFVRFQLSFGHPRAQELLQGVLESGLLGEYELTERGKILFRDRIFTPTPKTLDEMLREAGRHSMSDASALERKIRERVFKFLEQQGLKFDEYGLIVEE